MNILCKISSFLCHVNNKKHLIMKTELTLSARSNTVKNVADCMKRMTLFATSAIDKVGHHYSHLLGTKLNRRQTGLLINAQAAFVFTVFPVECSIVVRLFCLAWLVLALLQCKHSGIHAAEE